MARLTRTLKALRDAAARNPTATLAAGGAAAGGLLDDEEGALVGAATGASLGLLDSTARRAGSARPANVPQSQAGIFAGFRAAQGAPTDALALAEKMAREGRMSRLEVGSAPWHELNRRIHEATGREYGAEGAVHFGVDMLPRWEISDRFAMTVNDDPSLRAPIGDLRTWWDRSDYLRHNPLDAAYPETRKIPVGWRDPGPGTGYGEAGYVGPDQGRTPSIEMDASLLDAAGNRMDTPRTIMLHELQHDIQSREGFARGANPDLFLGQRNPMLEYSKVAGEAEARAVEARRDLSQLQRAQRYPFEDYTLPVAVPSDNPKRWTDMVDWDQTVPVPLDRRWWNNSPQATRSPDIYGLFDD